MLFLLPIAFVFAWNYYAFRWYLRRRGRSTDTLVKDLTLSFVIAGIVGAGVFFVSLPFFLTGDASPLGTATIELFSLVVWGAAFVIPLPLFVKRKLKTPWLVTLWITLTPIALSLIVWNLVAFADKAQYDSNRAPAQYQSGDLADITYGGIRLISPNGGESFKIGNSVQITWKAFNVVDKAAGAQLDVELFEIKGDKPLIDKNNICTNCMGSGLRSGISAVPLKTGEWSATWVAGKQYSGGSVTPGNNYVMKATVSKTGSPSECPATVPTCTVELDVGWSDAAFSLTN